MLRLVERLGRRLDAVRPSALWSTGYGLARTLLAIGTAGTLAFTGSEVLFHPVAGSPPAPHCFHAGAISIFCVVPNPSLARWLAVALLIMVATGWRPRYTALVHWWIAFSVQTSATVIDGGDQVTAVLTLLLLPLALSDPRRWQWAKPDALDVQAGWRIAAALGRTMIVVQVSALYFNAAISKLGVLEWTNGTALYYWLTDPTFGPPSWLGPPLEAAALSAAGVVVLTWGTVVLELAISLAWAFPRSAQRVLLAAGLAFHVGIAAAMGLVSFGFAMAAALLLYLPLGPRQPRLSRSIRAASEPDPIPAA